MGYRVKHFVNSLTGGTGVAAVRLHLGLVAKGVESFLHYREGEKELKYATKDSRFAKRFNRLFENWIISRRWAMQTDGGGIFINQGWIYKTPLSHFGEYPDIVHLNLVHRWLDLKYFIESVPFEIPIVWSLHDLHPLTGGCTHAIGCHRYENACGNCPNLKEHGPKDQSYQEFKIKRSLYKNRKITFVANSQWTYRKAMKSALCSDPNTISVIPLGVDAEKFRPIDKSVAKQALQIPENAFVLGFGCSDLSDPNKGMHILLDALSMSESNSNVYLLYFGSGHFDGSLEGIPNKGLGKLQSCELQCLFYSACELFVVPSQIESFCLTALESMACGTPVLAFRTGGIPDLIENQITGLLEDEIGSREGLAQKITWGNNNPKILQEMGVQARQVVEQKFTTAHYAEAYEKIYCRLLGEQLPPAT